MNLSKLAASDAAKWARAEMFFGEGAGTRRKLLKAEITDKMAKIEGYNAMFTKAYDAQNMAEHAIKAAKERKHIDRMSTLNKNTKSLLRGDKKGLSTGVLVVVGIGYVLYQTGYDRVLIREAKTYYRNTERKIKVKMAAYKLQRDFERNQ